MRRPTLNPRPSIRPTPRLSVPTLKNTRQVRDKSHIQSCTTTLEHFLLQYNFPLTNRTLTSPSAKEASQMFKFIFSLIDPTFEFSSRIEDDVVNILKGLKYPYMSEINRSQFVAVTPHAWPAILSMFVWLIELVSFMSDKEVITSMNSLFYEHVKNNYNKFLNGEEEVDDNIFKEKVYKMYQEIFSEIDKRVAILKEIENKIENMMDNCNKDEGKITKEELISKKNDVLNDIRSLSGRKKQLDEKRKKYEMINNKSKVVNQELEDELRGYKIEVENLKKVILDQKINPEDLKEMNKEKIDMYNELEKLRPLKEECIKLINDKERVLNEKVDEIEKLLYDLKSLRSVVVINLKKENNEYKIEGNTVTLDREINEESMRCDDNYSNAELTLSSFDMKISDYECLTREVKQKLMHLDEKLLTLGKLYLEKKSVLEIEQRKNINELNKIESELMKLSLESNNAFVSSDQRLQVARIQYDKIKNKVRKESEEITNEINALVKYLSEKKNEITAVVNKKQ